MSLKGILALHLSLIAYWPPQGKQQCQGFLIFVNKLAETSWEKKYLFDCPFQGMSPPAEWPLRKKTKQDTAFQGSPPTISYFRPISPPNKAILLGTHKDSIHWSDVSPHDVSGEALTHTFGSVFYWSPTELTRLFLLVHAHSSPLYLPYYNSWNTGASQREWNFLVFHLYKSILSGILFTAKRSEHTQKWTFLLFLNYSHFMCKN